MDFKKTLTGVIAYAIIPYINNQRSDAKWKNS